MYSSPAPIELEFGIHVRQLVDGILDATDVLQLAAGMAVHQLQAVEHVARLQNRRAAPGSR